MSKDELMIWFYEKLFSCYPVKNVDYPGSIFWFYDEKFIRKIKISKVNNKDVRLPRKVKGICLFEEDTTTGCFNCDYNQIWMFISNNYIDDTKCDYETVQYLVKEFLNSYDDNRYDVWLLFNNFIKINNLDYIPKAHWLLDLKTDHFDKLSVYKKSDMIKL